MTKVEPTSSMLKRLVFSVVFMAIAFQALLVVMRLLWGASGFFVTAVSANLPLWFCFCRQIFGGRCGVMRARPWALIFCHCICPFCCDAPRITPPLSSFHVVSSRGRCPGIRRCPRIANRFGSSRGFQSPEARIHLVSCGSPCDVGCVG